MLNRPNPHYTSKHGLTGSRLGELVEHKLEATLWLSSASSLGKILSR